MLLVALGLVACFVGEHFAYHTLLNISIGTNAAGLTLLTQSHTQVTNRDGGTTNIEAPLERPADDANKPSVS